LLAEAIDRANFVAALGLSGLAPRATLLEGGLDGIAAPTPPPWFAVPLSNRLPMLRTQADRLFGKSKPTISIALPAGTGSDLLLAELQRDWGALGLRVERAAEARNADFALIDEVAPSSSPSWFIRRFRCEIALVCDPKADELMDAARQSADPAQRYALLGQAAARIESGQLFIPITAPIRWSLVSPRIQNFAGNRYGRHTLIDLEQRPNGE
jgi:peptide/nickel transport system substrate-binding protein